MKDILATVKPVEKSVTLCLAGDLQARFEDLERRLSAAVRSPHATLGSGEEERRLADAIQAVRAEMAEQEVTFHFRALSARKWSDLMAEHPGRSGKDEAFNVDTFPDALIAACAVDPEMTPEEVKELGDSLSNAQFSTLFDCAWGCNQSALDVPFSVLASQALRASETS